MQVQCAANITAVQTAADNIHFEKKKIIYNLKSFFPEWNRKMVGCSGVVMALLS